MKNNEKKVATIFDFARMCKSVDCCGCPMFLSHNGYEKACLSFFRDHTEEANNMILTWIEEEEKKNKVKTYADDFFEKFPNAAKMGDGMPKICILNIYPEVEDCHSQPCKDCWNMPYKGNVK